MSEGMQVTVITGRRGSKWFVCLGSAQLSAFRKLVTCIHQ